MAIYHLSAKIIKRSAGRSAVAAAAYRAGAKFKDKRTGLTHSYVNRKDVVHSELLTPDVVPLFAADRETLWNTVELGEKRKDAQLSREIELALPRELSRSQQITLTRSFVQDNFVGRGMIADVAIHDKNEGNPHAHIMLTMRELSADGFGEKARQWNDKKLMKDWRASWEKEVNQALELAGSKERIDHRTLEAQGIDRVPQIHLGMSANALQDKNKPSERTERLNQIKQHNVLYLAEIRALKAEQAQIEKEIEAYELDHRPTPTPTPTRRSRGSTAPKLEPQQELDPMTERMRAVNAALDRELMTPEERFKQQKEWVETGKTLAEAATEKQGVWREFEALEADINKAGQDNYKKLDEWSNGETLEQEAKKHRDFVDQGTTIEEVAAERSSQLDKWQKEASEKVFDREAWIQREVDRGKSREFAEGILKEREKAKARKAAREQKRNKNTQRKKDMVLIRKLPNKEHEEFRVLWSKDIEAAKKLPYYKVWQAANERRDRKIKNEDVIYDVEEMHHEIEHEKQKSRNEEADLKREAWIEKQMDNGISFDDAYDIYMDRKKAKARKVEREKDKDNDLER